MMRSAGVQAAGLVLLCFGASVVYAAQGGAAQVGTVQGGSAQVRAAGAKTPVLVELFTSEGCSSCPAADALLRELDKQPSAEVEIIVLGEHVDYWDRLGWRDRFSSHEFTERQGGYGQRFGLGDIYTPQMVVDGLVQFVGNDRGQAERAIAKAGRAAKIDLTLSEVKVDRDHVSGTISVAGGGPALSRGDLFAALVDSSAVTQVRSGENGGRELRHVGVVRSLVRVGSVQELSRGAIHFTLAAAVDAAARERVVVFAQGSGQGAVLGAAVREVPGQQRAGLR